MSDMDPTSAESFGTEWMKAAETEATVSATGHALLGFAANLALISERYGEDYLIPPLDAMTRHRFSRLDRLYKRVVDLGVEDIPTKLISEALRHGEFAPEQIPHLEPVLKTALIALLQSERTIAADDARITLLAETALEISVGMGDEPSLAAEGDAEKAAYAFSAWFIRNARLRRQLCEHVPPERAAETDELDAMLAELIA